MRRSAEQQLRRAYDSLDPLAKRVSYWLYVGRRPARARQYAARLSAVLDLAPNYKNTVHGSGLHARVAEAFGRWDEVVLHRAREVRLLDRVRAMRGGERVVPHRYVVIVLGQLADACIEAGQRRQALVALERARTICRAKRLRFEDEELVARALALPSRRRR